VLLSSYAPSFASHGDLVQCFEFGSGEQWFWRQGWSWLLKAAENEGLHAWHRQKRLKRALSELDSRHPGEIPLWLRWSHPGTLEEMLRSWSTYRRWWRRQGAPIDLVGVVDRGLGEGRVWHIHGYGYGQRLDLPEHAEAWGRAGGYPFVRAREFRRGTEEARGYLVRRLRGYITRKEGSRYLRLRVADAGSGGAGRLRGSDCDEATGS
jgi:hypothetical protein